MKLNPEVAARTCEACRTYDYDDSKRVGGPVMKRAGRKQLRVIGQPTPCNRCPKIPPDAPPFAYSAVELSEKNWRALRFHQRCKAVGRFPEDAIVFRNAGLIEATLAEIRELRERETHEMLTVLLQIRSATRG